MAENKWVANIGLKNKSRVGLVFYVILMNSELLLIIGA